MYANLTVVISSTMSVVRYNTYIGLSSVRD